MPVAIAGEVDFDPAVRDAVVRGAKALIQQALAQPGCRHYAWTLDPFLPGRVHVFEEWDTPEQLAAHLSGPACAGMIAHLSSFGILGAVTRKYRVDLVEPVYGPDGKPTATFLTAG